MSGKIEVGCLVMVINAMWDKTQVGKCYTVESARDDLEGVVGDKVWQLEKEFPNCSPACWLLRIDDHQEETETQEQEMTV